MTEETYNKILNDINTMTDKEYQDLLNKSKEMDKDFEKMIEVMNNDCKRIN